MRKLLALLLFAMGICGIGCSSETSDPAVPQFRIDPNTVQRFGPAYRYPQSGWIFVHIEGEPYERGFQHGKLLSIEIAKQVECLAVYASAKSPADGWKQMRTTVNAVFVRKFDPEYVEEMQGIADGAASAGAQFDGRSLDLVDIVAINVWAEIMTLDAALAATPNGLEGKRFPDAPPKAPPPPQGEHCSSFIANGKATADGKIVFGHISMYDLYPSSFFNVWVDIKPAKGNRILMQSIPGGIQSGLDYYITSAGMLVSETTINQTRFNPDGQALTSQIRKAVQYGDSIDSIVAILEKGGNGLYSNEWLIGDIKTNEIAMFELGTQKSRLFRSSKNDWYGGTDGFYWGDNNVKDRAVKLETLASLNERPVNVVYHAKDRDRLWYASYQKYKGKIDARIGREFLNSPLIAMTNSVDAKVTTADDAKQFTTWALFGPPLGRTWQPTFEDRVKYPDIQPMVSTPWTQINALLTPPSESPLEPIAVDLHGARKDEKGFDAKSTKPAWHGTLLAKTDGDLWLATAFADYEKMFSQERERAASAPDQCLCAADKLKTIQTVFGARSKYVIAAQSTGDTPLAEIKTTPANDDWYRIASGKGLLLLHELRGIMGDKLFAESMDAFGTQHAGQEVATADFVALMQKASGKDLKPFFDFWLTKPGLPRLKLVSADVRERAVFANGTVISAGVVGVLSVENGPMPESLEVTIETAKGEITRVVHPQTDGGKFRVETGEKPLRLIVDKYGRSAIANGAIYSQHSFMMAWEKTLIVYGTDDESAANAEAARELQSALILRGANFTVPIRSDRDLSEDDLRTHNLLLIGRPDCNRITRTFAGAFRTSFGTRSFKVGNELYAHACSAAAAAAPNPREPRNVIVVIAGLSPAATYAAAQAFGHGDMHGDVSVLDGAGTSASGGVGGGKIRSFVMPAVELQKEFDAK